VKEGDVVKSGDILAEIETDKATMEFEAVDEGTMGQILVAEGSDGVKVGAPIALLLEEGEDASTAKVPTPAAKKETLAEAPKPAPEVAEAADPAPKPEAKAALAPAPAASGDRIKASPLARRLAEQQGVDLAGVTGSGPYGRIVRADLEGAKPGTAAAPAARSEASTAAPPSAIAAPALPAIPHEVAKLSNMRKTIARRLTESKQQIPHIYLTVDIHLDPLLELRGELNKGLESRGVKLSVNDLLVKALAVALIEVPKCNVMFAGDQLVSFSRADISVAVSIPGGLITPVVVGAKPSRCPSLPPRSRISPPARGTASSRRMNMPAARPASATWACTASSSSRR
jgi:pyruvate dehydrogenase E2 component (dihydrolipoamide acetyltransferase)